MNHHHLLELPKQSVLPPIGRSSWNLLENNILKLDSDRFMMLTLMGGMQMISIGVAIRRDGL
jgi:hypothetical protein